MAVAFDTAKVGEVVCSEVNDAIEEFAMGCE